MEEQFKESMPIYMQLMEEIRYSVVSGRRRPGERLETVRELAQAWGVNPNTVQRALSELEREGLLYSERTAGRFVTEDQEKICALRQQMAKALTEEFFSSMNQIGFDREGAMELLGKTADEGKAVENTCTA